MSRVPGRGGRTRAARRSRPAGLVAVVALTIGATAIATTIPAGATPVTDARARAAALATQVDELRTRAAVATERYNRVESRLTRVSTEAIQAEQRVAALQRLGAEGHAEAARRVSAIYRAGGGLSLYATVLDGGSPNDVLVRLRTVQNIVDQDQGTTVTLDGAVAEAQAAQGRLDELTRERRDLTRSANEARTEVTSLLAEQEAAFEAADAEVTELVEQEQQRRQAAQEAAARSTLQEVGVLLGDDAPGTPYATAAIAAAQSKLGLPYLWGGTGPNAYDCSGLVQWAYRQAGLNILRVAADQYRSGPEVELSAIAPGDLVFWSKNPANKAAIHHVAMYVGNGRMIEAPYTGAVIRVVPLRLGPEFAGAVRPGA